MSREKLFAILAYFSLICATVSMIGIPENARADTWHGGHITGTEEWKPGDNDHIVKEHVYVDMGAILKIYVGSVVKFDDDMGLFVDGKLIIISGYLNYTQVLFTSSNGKPSEGIWYGIQFNMSSTSDSFLANSTIEYATYGVRFAHTNTSARILRDVTITNSTYGIQADTSYIKFVGGEVRDCEYGVNSSWTATEAPQGYVDIVEGAFTNISQVGILLHADVVAQSVRAANIENNTISGNGYGVHLWNASAQIYNNNISSNIRGIRGFGSAAWILSNEMYSNILNGIYFSKGIWASANSVEIEGNLLVNSPLGITVFDSHGNISGNNVSYSNAWGIATANTTGLIENNTLYANGWYNGNWANCINCSGLLVQTPTPNPYDLMVMNNTVVNNSRGVILNGYVFLGNNSIQENYYGIISGYYGSGKAILDNNTISWNSHTGVRLFRTYDFTIAIYNQIENNTIYGAYFDNGANGTLNMNNIANNTKTQDSYGVYNADNSVKIGAKHNWWGDPTGPQHGDNPFGNGDPAWGEMDFDPWESLPIGGAGP
ncbi:MAG: hypothetical protein E3J35_08500 [Methanomassiliicoccales archaeon]|nr:MAG: hypothetical protein E3J35_08500 [Methanomassiliicoccales archaeon]